MWRETRCDTRASVGAVFFRCRTQRPGPLDRQDSVKGKQTGAGTGPRFTLARPTLSAPVGSHCNLCATSHADTCMKTLSNGPLAVHAAARDTLRRRNPLAFAKPCPLIKLPPTQHPRGEKRPRLFLSRVTFVSSHIIRRVRPVTTVSCSTTARCLLRACISVRLWS